MVSPGDITGGLSGFFQGQVVSSILVWTGYILVGSLIIGFFVALYFLTQFKYKIRYYERRDIKFDEKEDKGKPFFGLGKLRRDLARRMKDKGVPKWHLLLANKKIEPVKYEYIGEKNVVHMLRTGDETFIPCKAEKKFVVGNHLVDSLTPFDADVRFWEQNELHQAAIETVKEGYHKQLMMISAGIIIAILIFAAVTIWFMLQAAQGTVAKIDLVSTAISSLQQMGPG